MSDSNKTWVIGITDDLELRRSGEEPPTPTRPMIRPVSRPLPTRAIARPQPRPVVNARPARQLHYALLVALTYLLGPFALVLTERGRRGRAWLIAGTVAGLAGIALTVWRVGILARVEASWTAVVLGGITSAVLMIGFSAWARALLLTRDPDASARKTRRQAFPTWLRKPAVLGGLGFVVPGLGLLLAGRGDLPRLRHDVLNQCQGVCFAAFLKGFFQFETVIEVVE